MKLNEKKELLEYISNELYRELEISKAGNFLNNYQRHRNCQVNIELQKDEAGTTLSDILRIYYIDLLKDKEVISEEVHKNLCNCYREYIEINKMLGSSLFGDNISKSEKLEQIENNLNEYGVLSLNVDLVEMVEKKVETIKQLKYNINPYQY